MPISPGSEGHSKKSVRKTFDVADSQGGGCDVLSAGASPFFSPTDAYEWVLQERTLREGLDREFTARNDGRQFSAQQNGA